MIMIIKGSRFVCVCVCVYIYVPYKYKYDGDSTSDESEKYYNNYYLQQYHIYEW